MSEFVTLEIPDDLARQARALAAATNRPLEEAVVEWIGRAVADPVVESLLDDELLSLCDSMLPDSHQETLSDLLAREREASLDEPCRERLDELMTAYRHGLVLKARAWNEAVKRGLRRRLDDHAA